ncbi:MAG TPA: LDL receptor domain-containing protein, partial [Polyangiales bacterium]|nr:LDL receptor domain-containing protein [Polyangiales bacterium]
GGCAADQFFCPKEAQCISKALVCDLADDCSDGADEMGCASACPGGQVPCPNGGCAPSLQECGGGQSCGPDQVPCADQTDAQICATRCDQNTECKDGADEDVRECCDMAEGIYCNTGSQMECVGKANVCANDGSQCANGIDEDPVMCCRMSDGLLCAGPQGQLCVPKQQVCAADGEQCLDGKDEEPQFCCEQNHDFWCRTSLECIDGAKTCDQVNDCTDQSDEEPGTCGCPVAGEDACEDGKQCIAANLFCNGGTPDCTDGSDEGAFRCGCPQGQFTCPDKKTCAATPGECPPQ